MRLSEFNLRLEENKKTLIKIASTLRKSSVISTEKKEELLKSIKETLNVYVSLESKLAKLLDFESKKKRFKLEDIFGKPYHFLASKKQETILSEMLAKFYVLAQESRDMGVSVKFMNIIEDDTNYKAPLDEKYYKVVEKLQNAIDKNIDLLSDVN